VVGGISEVLEPDAAVVNTSCIAAGLFSSTAT
jgi:phage shock protein PspC (stress-responsive transcriptional regulator)